MDFSILEQHKENIQPKPSGRPASRLALALKEHPPKTAIVAKKNEFEQLIALQDDLDDPLQPYLDYISWTNDTFPQGGNTESGLLALLERCTSCFRDTSFYKNDPRYLKVWLEYLQYSDLPREIFVYLAKKRIGSELALFYEEFAKYLEAKGAFNDAMEVYNVGIEREARPLSRLQRSYGYFQRRTQNMDFSRPSSIRSVLQLKRGSPPSFDGIGSEVPSKRSRISIHRDSETFSLKDAVFGKPESVPEAPPALKLKENILTARPWAGEIIKQKGSRPNSALGAKFEVFKDSKPSAETKEWHVESESDLRTYTVIRQPGKPTEKLMVNMSLLYPSSGEEFSPMEIYCQVRNFNAERKKAKSIPQDLNTTITIPLSVDETTNYTLRPRSPTMTQFSRITANEVLGMFNNASRYHLDEDTTKFEDHTSNLDGFVTETFHEPRNEEQAGPGTPSTEQGLAKSSPFLDRPW